MYYDHDKSLTGDGDDFNDDYIGTYVFTGIKKTPEQNNQRHSRTQTFYQKLSI